MKFTLKQNFLPKNIKLLQKYIDESSSESSYESSYDSCENSTSDSYESESDEDSDSTSDSDESNSDDSDSDESYDSVSTAGKNFSIFLREFNKNRKYSIKVDPLNIYYDFTSNRVGGQFLRHKDKEITLGYRFLDTNKESVRNTNKNLMLLEQSSGDHRFLEEMD
jgi:hypothetical protein